MRLILRRSRFIPKILLGLCLIGCLSIYLVVRYTYAATTGNLFVGGSSDDRYCSGSSQTVYTAWMNCSEYARIDISNRITSVNEESYAWITATVEFDNGTASQKFYHMRRGGATGSGSDINVNDSFWSEGGSWWAKGHIDMSSYNSGKFRINVTLHTDYYRGQGPYIKDIKIIGTTHTHSYTLTAINAKKESPLINGLCSPAPKSKNCDVSLLLPPHRTHNQALGVS